MDGREDRIADVLQRIHRETRPLNTEAACQGWPGLIMKKYWVGLLLLTYGSLLVVLSVFKSAEYLLEYLYQLEDYFGGDKQMHLKLAAMLSILGCFGG